MLEVAEVEQGVETYERPQTKTAFKQEQREVVPMFGKKKTNNGSRDSKLILAILGLVARFFVPLMAIQTTILVLVINSKISTVTQAINSVEQQVGYGYKHLIGLHPDFHGPGVIGQLDIKPIKEELDQIVEDIKSNRDKLASSEHNQTAQKLQSGVLRVPALTAPASTIVSYSRWAQHAAWWDDVMVAIITRIDPEKTRKIAQDNKTTTLEVLKYACDYVKKEAGLLDLESADVDSTTLTIKMTL